MPKSKPPQDTNDDERRVSILDDIEKSATVHLNQINDISVKLTEPLIQNGALTAMTEAGTSAMKAIERFGGLVAQPQNGVLGISDISASVKAINDLATSPVFTYATEALAETRRINEQITSIRTDFIERMPDLTKFTEAMQSVTEPIVRLQETARVLNKVHNFDLSIKAIEAFPVTTKHWMGEAYEVEPYITRPPQIQITAAIAVLKERVDNLADEISEKVELKFQEQIDILIEKSIIPVGIKQANCHCIHCDRLVFKVEDMSHFMVASHKCQCGETLQIPRDLKIVPL